MKVSRIFVALLVMFAFFRTSASARAEINTNFVKEFLNRYRPLKAGLPAAAQSSQDVASLIRTGQLPLSVGDLINLIIQRSEEHTSELQSRENLVCRLLLEKKKGRSKAEPTRPTQRSAPTSCHALELA